MSGPPDVPPSVPVHLGVLALLPDELRDVVIAARTRLKDDSIMVRVEAYDGRPGFVTVSRGGADVEIGLSQEAVIPYLRKLR